MDTGSIRRWRVVGYKENDSEREDIPRRRRERWISCVILSITPLLYCAYLLFHMWNTETEPIAAGPITTVQPTIIDSTGRLRPDFLALASESKSSKLQLFKNTLAGFNA